MKVTIQVEKIEFDASQCSLRLNGPNVKENEHIRMGQYHTLEIELGRAFTISKDCWDSIHMELLDELSDPMKKAEVAAVVMQEGLAHLCLIKSAMTKTCARIEKSMPKKKQVSVAYTI
jgi:protein pelota